ncbi:MAG: amidohydrolase family protein, partial [Myxococcota bacterium]
MEADLVVRNAKLPSGLVDLVVHGGSIAEISPCWNGRAKREIDAEGLLVLPGFIDAHVHLNEPGR